MPLFENVVSAKGRDFSRCLDCRGYCRPDLEAKHRCPRDMNGQIWTSEVWRDPYGEKYTCPGCGEKTEQMELVWIHWCDGAEAVAEFKATLERAIDQAFTDGAAHALETAALIAEAESNRYAPTWGESSAGHKALLRVAAEIRSRKGGGDGGGGA